jgi:outer membrane lipoprotein SlyB
MKPSLLVIGVVGSISSAACVAGPGGSNNAANRTIAGAAAGAALGGLAGSAVGGGAVTGAMVGALAGGALGAAINPNHTFKRDTRGHCVLVDENGNQVFDAQGQAIIDYKNPC